MFNKANKNVRIGMTAGDPSRSTYDASSLEDQEIGFSCYCMGLEGSTCNVPAGGPDQYKSFAEVKSFACDVVRLETMFPSCWNGVDEDRWVNPCSSLTQPSCLYPLQ